MEVKPFGVCNCADIPPTMPTCRIEHLIDCPLRIMMEVMDSESMRILHAEAQMLLRDKDQDGLKEFLGRNIKERAYARWTRQQWQSSRN